MSEQDYLDFLNYLDEDLVLQCTIFDDEAYKYTKNNEEGVRNNESKSKLQDTRRG